MIIKKVKENWINEFTNHLDKAESKEFRKIRKYYQEQYFEGVDLFLKNRQTTGFDRLFQPNQLVDAFSGIYSNIGLSFALWYSKNFERLIKRQDVSNYNDTWQATFAAEGKRIAGSRVTLVQGTAKATLTKELTRFMRNPEFMSLNEREASRILRSRFNQYSNFQAKRLVRTEATNAANLGVMRSALDMFGADSLEKEWIAALDERVRSAHGATIENVAFNEKFSVGGELLDRPGDPAGSPKNVINCRCSVAPFPKEDAEAISQIDSLEFDIAQEAFDPSSFGLTSRTVAPVVEEVFANKINTIDDVLESNNNVPKNTKELLENIDDFDLSIFEHFKKPLNLRIKNVRANHQAGTITIPKYKRASEIKKVFVHEIGHFVADSRGWIVRGIIDKDSAAKPIIDIYNKWSKYCLNKKNTKRLWNELNEVGYDSFETLGKQIGYESSRDFLDDLGAMKDTFGALTKERLGGGHGKSYYNKINMRWHEFIAHSYENKFVGNKLFKKMYPEMYNDMIKLVDELNINY